MDAVMELLGLMHDPPPIEDKKGVAKWISKMHGLCAKIRSAERKAKNKKGKGK